MTYPYDLVVADNIRYDKFFYREAPVVDVNGNPVLDANNQPTYADVDMTGWLGHLQVRSSYDASSAIVDITEVADADGQLIFGNGFVEVVIEPTTKLAAGMVYDLLIRQSVNAPWAKFMAGTIKKERTVTR